MWAYEVGPEYPDLWQRKNNSEWNGAKRSGMKNYDDEGHKGKDIQIHILFHIQSVSRIKTFS
jgi:hypothetical protein